MSVRLLGETTDDRRTDSVNGLLPAARALPGGRTKRPSHSADNCSPSRRSAPTLRGESSMDEAAWSCPLRRRPNSRNRTDTTARTAPISPKDRLAIALLRSVRPRQTSAMLAEVWGRSHADSPAPHAAGPDQHGRVRASGPPNWSLASGRWIRSGSAASAVAEEALVRRQPCPVGAPAPPPASSPEPVGTRRTGRRQRWTPRTRRVRSPPMCAWALSPSRRPAPGISPSSRCRKPAPPADSCVRQADYRRQRTA